MEQVASSNQSGRIEISDAAKSFADFQVFENINLSVGEREILSLVGPSGCGKTTLLRCIDGLIPLSRGSVSIDGEEVVGPPPGVAVVFQHFGLFPWKTVFGNVSYGLKMAGASKSEIQEKVPHFIDMVGLDGFEDSYPYQLSGGMQQRAGLARALAVEPRVLLMDEPFGSLDAQTRELLQYELLRIWEQNRVSMVFVTHSIDEAVLMGDRVAVLRGRPSGVHDLIDVDLRRPRDRSTLKEPKFRELTEHVWGQLMADAARAVREGL